MGGNKHLLGSIRIDIREVVIQEEAQIVFQLGDKGKGFMRKGRGTIYISKRKALLLIKII